MSYNFNMILEEIVSREEPEIDNGLIIGTLMKSDHLSAGRTNPSTFEILEMSEFIAGCSSVPLLNEDYRHRNYDLATIRKVLASMDECGWKIKDAARVFGISRNTISKWRKTYKVRSVGDPETE